MRRILILSSVCSALVLGGLVLAVGPAACEHRVVAADSVDISQQFCANGGMLSRPSRPGHPLGNTVRRVVYFGRGRA